MIESAAQFRALRLSDDLSEQRRASHEEALLEVWLAVIREQPDLRFWVAQNKTVPLEVLALLARDSDPRVRFVVASKRKLTVELQLLIARDPDPSVVAALAHNRSLEASVREVLSTHNDSLVREALEANRLRPRSS